MSIFSGDIQNQNYSAQLDGNEGQKSNPDDKTDDVIGFEGTQIVDVNENCDSDENGLGVNELGEIDKNSEVDKDGDNVINDRSEISEELENTSDILEESGNGVNDGIDGKNLSGSGNDGERIEGGSVTGKLDEVENGILAGEAQSNKISEEGQLRDEKDSAAGDETNMHAASDVDVTDTADGGMSGTGGNEAGVRKSESISKVSKSNFFYFSC